MIALISRRSVEAHFRSLCAERERYIQAFGATFSPKYASVAFFIDKKIDDLLLGYLANEASVTA